MDCYLYYLDEQQSLRRTSAARQSVSLRGFCYSLISYVKQKDIFKAYSDSEDPDKSAKFAQADLRFRCPFTESLDTVESQQTTNVGTTSLQRRCNVVTLQRRCNDVVTTLCVCWDISTAGKILSRLY